jgi:hypothetical protein
MDLFVGGLPHAPATVGTLGAVEATDNGGKSIACNDGACPEPDGPFRARLLLWRVGCGFRLMAQSGRAGKGCFEDVEVDVKVRREEDEVVEED